MKELFETAFYLLYLVIVITSGIIMVRRCHGRKQYRFLAVSAILLGTGDAFYLLPRAYALSMENLENNTWVSGIGMLIAILSHVAFFVMLYHVARIRYKIHEMRPLTVLVYSFAALTFVLHALPQNHWFTNSSAGVLSIIRTIPYVAIGIIDILVFAKGAKTTNDRQFKSMPLAIACNYGCYIPVVIWIRFAPSLWTLMIPQACTFAWIIFLGFRAMSNEVR